VAFLSVVGNFFSLSLPLSLLRHGPVSTSRGCADIQRRARRPWRAALATRRYSGRLEETPDTQPSRSPRTSTTNSLRFPPSLSLSSSLFRTFSFCCYVSLLLLVCLHLHFHNKDQNKTKTNIKKTKTTKGHSPSPLSFLLHVLLFSLSLSLFLASDLHCCRTSVFIRVKNCISSLTRLSPFFQKRVTEQRIVCGGRMLEDSELLVQALRVSSRELS